MESNAESEQKMSSNEFLPVSQHPLRCTSWLEKLRGILGWTELEERGPFLVQILAMQVSFFFLPLLIHSIFPHISLLLAIGILTGAVLLGIFLKPTIQSFGRYVFQAWKEEYHKAINDVKDKL